MNQRYRLKKNYQFKYTYKKGTIIFSKHLSLCFAKGTKRAVKIGFSVSNKIGKAVVRNKIKRRLRAICKDKLGSFILGYNYIFVAKQSLITIKYSEVESLIVKLLSEVKSKIG